MYILALAQSRQVTSEAATRLLLVCINTHNLPHPTFTPNTNYIICEQVKQSHMPFKDCSGQNRLGVTTSCCNIGPYDLILGVKVFCFGSMYVVNTNMKIAGAPQSLAEIGGGAGETCTVMSVLAPPPPPYGKQHNLCECVHMYMYMYLAACVPHCRTPHSSLEV